MTLTRRAVLAAGAAAASALLPRMEIAVTSPALFVAAHPDDETLAMGVAIAEHVADGQEVHLLLLTDGTASSVRTSLNGTGTRSWWGVPHVPAAEGYEPLDTVAFGAARVAEAETAARCLASGLPGTLTVHRAGLQDGAVTQADAAAAIVALADEVAPGGAPVRVKTHSHIVDNHPDHLAAGAAAQQLAADPRFANLRHYILPAYWTDARLSEVAESWDTPSSTQISVRARNACRAYGAWHPPASYAIGYHSTSAMFDQITSSPKCLFHP